MKKIEKQIKNSIQINNLDFLNTLPHIPKKTNIKYVIPILILSSFIFYININKKIPIEEIADTIVINNIEYKDKYSSFYKINTMEQNVNMNVENTTINQINTYYNINLKENNLYKSYNETIADKIIQTIIEYKENEKNTVVIINKSDNMLYNKELFNYLITLPKSKIDDINLTISQNDIYYVALFKDNINYLIYSELNELNLIKFIKENII